jgi:hypothetical protein
MRRRAILFGFPMQQISEVEEKLAGSGTINAISALLSRARICKRHWILPAYAAWRAGTTNRVVILGPQAGIRFLGSSKGVQIGL